MWKCVLKDFAIGLPSLLAFFTGGIIILELSNYWRLFYSWECKKKMDKWTIHHEGRNAPMLVAIMLKKKQLLCSTSSTVITKRKRKEKEDRKTKLKAKPKIATKINTTNEWFCCCCYSTACFCCCKSQMKRIQQNDNKIYKNNSNRQ